MKKINIQFHLDKARSDIDVSVTAAEKDVQVNALIDRINDPLAGNLTVLDSDKAAVTISEESIISISTAKKKLRVLTEDGEYELKKTLREAVPLLHPQLFMQISRYEIINLAKVRRFDFSMAGTLQIEMTNGMRTWASRRFISEIKNRLRDKEERR